MKDNRSTTGVDFHPVTLSPCHRVTTAWLVAGAVFLSFFAFSAIQAPVPGPNEPYYLCKAKHYWDPGFCPDDVFLESANAHRVFYQTVGLLTRFLTLEQTAWLGRVIAYGLLAVGWTSCLRSITGDVRHALWSAWVFLALANFGNLSGEWMVGGLESKVFAYAFLLWGIAKLLNRRTVTAAALFGLAISFHPVVGVWGAIAAGTAIISYRVFRGKRPVSSRGNIDGSLRDASTAPQRNEKPGFFRPAAGPAAAVFLLCALPGLIPALVLVFSGGHSDAATANRILVFDRLAHHLDPMHFRTIDAGTYEIPVAWLQYALMLAFWLLLRTRVAKTPGESWFCRFVLAGGLIVLGGLLVGWMPRDENGYPAPDAMLVDLRVALMKFYPYRLFDAALPIALAAAFAQVLSRDDAPSSSLRRGGRATRFAVNSGLFGTLLAFALLWPIADRNPSHMTPEQRRNWIDVCRWVRDNTPDDAQVCTPGGSWAFKWYAQRAEFWSHKDVPQDTAGIIEWRRRRADFVNWYNSSETFSRDALRVLYEKQGVTHYICPASEVPFAIEPVYQNAGYRVYRLSDAESR